MINFRNGVNVVISGEVKNISEFPPETDIPLGPGDAVQITFTNYIVLRDKNQWSLVHFPLLRSLWIKLRFWKTYQKLIAMAVYLKWIEKGIYEGEK